MEIQTLQAEVRKERGKGPARRLRAQGMIPAVFYGPEVEPTPLSVSPKDLMKILSGEYRKNSVMKLSFGGREELAMVKSLDQDPVTYEPLHADFYRVSMDRTVEVEIPFKTTGRALGVQKGGILNVAARSVPLRCTPDAIPAKIVHDISKLDMHQTVSVGDLKLPEGTEALLPPARTLAIILQDRRAAQKGEGAEDAPAGKPGK